MTDLTQDQLDELRRKVEAAGVILIGMHKGRPEDVKPAQLLALLDMLAARDVDIAQGEIERGLLAKASLKEIAARDATIASLRTAIAQAIEALKPFGQHEEITQGGSLYHKLTRGDFRRSRVNVQKEISAND
jgi:hypothetical protein